MRDIWLDLKELLRHAIAVSVLALIDVGIGYLLRLVAPHAPPKLVETVQRFTHWFVIAALLFFAFNTILMLALNTYEASVRRLDELRHRRDARARQRAARQDRGGGGS